MGIAGRRVRAAALAVLLSLPSSLVLGAPAEARTTSAADLPALVRELAGATAQAQDLAAELEQAAARDGALRAAVQDLAQEQDRAHARLGQRVREAYMATVPRPPGSWAVPRDPGLDALVTRGAGASVRAEQALLDAASAQSQATGDLRAQDELFRARLQDRALRALQAQDRARELLHRAQAQAAAQAQARAAAQAQAGAQAAAQAQQARVATLAAESQAADHAAQLPAVRDQAAQVVDQQAGLDAARAALDAASASVTTALAPATTARGRGAAAGQAEVLALVEAAGAALPAGWAPTGEVLRGTASWYGPGFVGRPTASGAPYDPERLTCAHKALPLGTVLHVTANGRAVSCLVNDRGPYVGDRVVDLSRAGSRALGYTGTVEVVAEVLAPVG